MTTRREESHTGASDRRFGPLADETRRRIIRLLRGRSEPLPEEELAKQLADGGSDGTPRTSAAEGRSLEVRLHHVHLPKLAESGLVEWDRGEGSVAATDHPVYDAAPGEPIEPVDRSTMASPAAADRRREILAIVDAEDGSVTRSELAHELALRETNSDRTERSADEIRIQLHHYRLPRMEDEGLVEYSQDGEIAVAENGRQPAAIRRKGSR